MLTLFSPPHQALPAKAVAFVALCLEKFDSSGTTLHVLVLMVTQQLAGKRGVPTRGSPLLDEVPPTIFVGVDVPQSAHGIEKKHCLDLIPLECLE